MSEENLIACPYCAEKIQPLAKKCKHCGELLDAQLRDIETLKSQKQNVYMNAGGGGGGASSSSASSAGWAYRQHGLLFHLFMIFITGGLWIFWLIIREFL
jgi:hypothetical protein